MWHWRLKMQLRITRMLTCINKKTVIVNSNIISQYCSFLCIWSNKCSLKKIELSPNFWMCVSDNYKYIYYSSKKSYICHFIGFTFKATGLWAVWPCWPIRELAVDWTLHRTGSIHLPSPLQAQLQGKEIKEKHQYIYPRGSCVLH